MWFVEVNLADKVVHRPIVLGHKLDFSDRTGGNHASNGIPHHRQKTGRLQQLDLLGSFRIILLSQRQPRLHDFADEAGRKLVTIHP